MTSPGSLPQPMRAKQDAVMKPWLMAMLLLACSDDLAPARLSLLPSDDLIVVAHQDDDLLFMQPDVRELVAAHRPLTVVYVTAGDAQNGLPYVQARYRALRAAYAAIAGAHDWSCDW